jgi:hypothetical protein
MSDFTRVASARELLHGHVMSLNAKQHGVLRVTSGRLYVTTDQSPEDYFLEAGDTLDVPKSAHVVVETWNQNRAGFAEFTFQHPPSPAQTSAACQSPLARAE